MITLPRRKLKLWYSKSDYEKERANGTNKPSEPINNDNFTQSTVDETAKQPVGINDNIQPIDSDSNSLSAENVKQPSQAEVESNTASTTSQDSGQQSETLLTSTDNPIQTADKANNIQPASLQAATQETSVEIDNKSAENEKETLEKPQIDTNVQLIDGKQNQTLIELKWVKDQDKLADPLTRPDPEQITSPVESVVASMSIEVENKVPLTDSVENIGEFTDNLKSLLPTKAVICIGEYPISILLKGSFAGKRVRGVLPIFVEKSTKDVVKWGRGKLEDNNIVCLDEDIDTHFWYDILPYVADNESFFGKIKSKPIEKLQGAIMVSSTWNGISSALLPTLNSQFKEWNINSIALPLLPSKAQPIDGQFNSFACIGILASKQDTALVLFDRDNLESYIGVDRSGYAINGNVVLNYLLDLMLAKETFVPELCEMSKSFGSKMFTVLLSPGVSLKIYGSLENMLNSTLLRPLFTFDLSTATIVYVLMRMPFQLKDKLTRGKIELAVADWFKNKADLESIFITDPVYVEDSSDRIDIALFVGGFDTVTRFVALEKRIEKMKNKAVKKGSITEEDWQLITKSLLE